MSKRKNLNGYVRYDGNKRMVPGSYILDSKKPTGGLWKQVQDNVCCNNCYNSTNYTYKQTAGGTIDTEGLTLLSTDFYSNTFAPLPLGFTFNFENVDYTDVIIGSNGFLYFPDTSAYYANYLSTFPDNSAPTISILSTNQTYLLIDRPDGGIYYKQSGVAPNRVFSVIYKSSINWETYGQWDYQVNLYEGTNEIEMVYGDLADWSDVNIDSGWPVIGVEAFDDTYPFPLTNPFNVKLGGLSSAELSNTTILWTPSCTPFVPVDWNACGCYDLNLVDPERQYQYFQWYKCGGVIYSDSDAITTWPSQVCALADPRVAPMLAFGQGTVTPTVCNTECVPLGCSSCWEIEFLSEGYTNFYFTRCNGGNGGGWNVSAGMVGTKSWTCVAEVFFEDTAIAKATRLGNTTSNCTVNCFTSIYPNLKPKCYKVENPTYAGNGYFELAFTPKNAQTYPDGNPGYTSTARYSVTSGTPNGPIPGGDIYFCAYEDSVYLATGNGTIINLGTDCDCDVTYYVDFNNYVETLDCPACVPGNVEIPASTDFDITGNFTIEFWMNLANADGFPRIYSFDNYPAPNAVSIEGGGSIIYFWANGAALLAGVPSDVGVDLLNTWNHIAIVGNGASAYMYVNGYQIATAAYSGSISSGGYPFTIGFGNEPSSYFNGYLSNFRWTDSAVYTAPFNGSVPTSPLSALPTTKLLIFQGNTLPLELTDNSGNGHDATNSGAKFSSANPFGLTGSIQMGVV